MFYKHKHDACTYSKCGSCFAVISCSFALFQHTRGTCVHYSIHMSVCVCKSASALNHFSTRARSFDMNGAMMSMFRCMYYVLCTFKCLCCCCCGYSFIAIKTPTSGHTEILKLSTTYICSACTYDMASHRIITSPSHVSMCARKQYLPHHSTR